MTIAGFAFLKLLAEKKAAGRGNITINSNISLVSAEEIDFVMGQQRQKGIKVIFDYKNLFEPDIGTLIIGGEILYLSDQKKHDELMKLWAKKKGFTDDVTAELYDLISVRCTVEAIRLNSTVGLPPPVPLPRFSAGKPKQQQNLFGEKGLSKNEHPQPQPAPKGKKG